MKKSEWINVLVLRTHITFVWLRQIRLVSDLWCLARLSVSLWVLSHCAFLLARGYGTECPHPSAQLLVPASKIHQRCCYRLGKGNLDKEKVLSSRKAGAKYRSSQNRASSPGNADRRGWRRVLAHRCGSSILIERKEKKVGKHEKNWNQRSGYYALFEMGP